MKTVPLGIMPETIWVERRICELVRAMNRYVEAGESFPSRWADEFSRHTKFLAENTDSSCVMEESEE